jgi:hypothetical protein
VAPSPHLSDKGHEVVVVDNFVRWTIDCELSDTLLDSLLNIAIEHKGRVDPEVVMPSVSWRSGKARRRINKAPAEPSKV